MIVTVPLDNNITLSNNTDKKRAALSSGAPEDS